MDSDSNLKDIEGIGDIVSDELFNWMRDIRRVVHARPELAFCETETASLISGHLRALGIEHKTGVAKTGIVGRIAAKNGAAGMPQTVGMPGTAGAPHAVGMPGTTGALGAAGMPGLLTVALRADMDALPVLEGTGLPFASARPGVMHACGHDGHVAMLLGAAALLKERPPTGNVVLIFQPAEEADGGALKMIEEGAMEGVSAVFALHIDNHFQTGQIGAKRGIASAYTDGFEVNITGRGGHAARPQEAVDAILIAVEFINRLHAIKAREVDPLMPSVINVGELQAGTVYNAVAQTAVLRGTIRTIEDATRRRIIERLDATASALSALHGARVEITHTPGYPPIINHERECGIAESVAINLLGRQGVIGMPHPSLGGEDFAYFVQKAPGCFLRLGAAKPGCEYRPAHSPGFDFDEEAMRVGAAFLSEVARAAVGG
jgi:hippurate hydrolase